MRKDKKIVELEKQVSEMKKDKENDLFKKKEDYLNFKEDILKDMKNNILKSSIWQNIEEDLKSWKIRLYLRELFYDKNLNSCIYSFNKVEDKLTNTWEAYYEIIYYIIDYLNYSKIYETSEKCLSNNNCSIEEEYNKKIKELKWE